MRIDRIEFRLERIERRPCPYRPADSLWSKEPDMSIPVNSGNCDLTNSGPDRWCQRSSIASQLQFGKRHLIRRIEIRKTRIRFRSPLFARPAILAIPRSPWLDCRAAPAARTQADRMTTDGASSCSTVIGAGALSHLAADAEAALHLICRDLDHRDFPSSSKVIHGSCSAGIACHRGGRHSPRHAKQANRQTLSLRRFRAWRRTLDIHLVERPRELHGNR